MLIISQAKGLTPRPCLFPKELIQGFRGSSSNFCGLFLSNRVKMYLLFFSLHPSIMVCFVCLAFCIVLCIPNISGWLSSGQSAGVFLLYIYSSCCIVYIPCAATVLCSERELQGSGGPSLDAAALRCRLQPRGCGGVSTAPRRRRPRQRQRVSLSFPDLPEPSDLSSPRLLPKPYSVCSEHTKEFQS